MRNDVFDDAWGAYTKSHAAKPTNLCTDVAFEIYKLLVVTQRKGPTLPLVATELTALHPTGREALTLILEILYVKKTH